MDSRWTNGSSQIPLRAEIDTPALVVDREQVQANIDSMADAMAARAVSLRPHAKTHKSPEIARRQVAAGAVGLTVATLGEAETFADAGFEDLFIAYPLWIAGSASRRLKELSERARLKVGVESVPSARALASAATGLEVLVELDSGQHRTGVSPPEAVTIALACTDLGLDVVGVFTHGGHAYGSPAAAAQAGRDEVDAVCEAVELLAREGFHVGVASAGSTPSALVSATGVVNEERPGVYVFYDRQQIALGSCTPVQVAAFVLATVVSLSDKRQFVIDAGSKALSSDRPEWLEGHGIVAGFEDAVVTRIWEHHGVVRSNGPESPNIGDVVAVVPNHICSVVNLFDNYVVTSDGQVVGSWEITARGA